MATAHEQALDRARTRWPGVALRDEVFFAALTTRGIDANDRDLAIEELYLAQACAHGDAVAIAAFDSEYVAKISLYLARIEPVREIVDEVQQRVRTRVLVAEPGGVARIAEYGGRGPLAAWVRVVARSVHSNLRRERPLGETTMSESSPVQPVLSPELEALRERYLPLVNDAVKTAIAELMPRDRTLFKLHYLDGLPLERIGLVYGVHKATVSRWLAAARQSVLDNATKAVIRGLGAHHADAKSLLDVLRSQLDVSVAALLGSTAPSP